MRRCPGLEGVTVSSGVATMPDNVSGAEELISAADEALYESKRAGRDRYTLSTRTTKRRSDDLLERS
jgi:PleD family two-component response regulator